MHEKNPNSIFIQGTNNSGKSLLARTIENSVHLFVKGFLYSDNKELKLSVQNDHGVFVHPFEEMELVWGIAGGNPLSFVYRGEQVTVLFKQRLRLESNFYSCEFLISLLDKFNQPNILIEKDHILEFKSDLLAHMYGEEFIDKFYNKQVEKKNPQIFNKILGDYSTGNFFNSRGLSILMDTQNSIIDATTLANKSTINRSLFMNGVNNNIIRSNTTQELMDKLYKLEREAYNKHSVNLDGWFTGIDPYIRNDIIDSIDRSNKIIIHTGFDYEKESNGGLHINLN